MEDIPRTLSAEQIAGWDGGADVVVIGLGIAGACAALEAHRAGAKVLVIERSSGGGGASALSDGQFYLGGGTAVQRSCGYEDDPEEMFKYLASITDSADSERLRAYCDNSVAHFEWLEAQGIPFERTCYKGKTVFVESGYCLFSTGNEKVWPWRDIARPAPRGHQAARTTENAGLVVMRTLLARCEAEGIATMFDARALALVLARSGRVLGVEVRHDGRTILIEAQRSVILATGGFAMNAKMMREYVPLLGENSEALGVPYNDGSGILLGVSAGAATLGMAEGAMITAPIYPPEQLLKGIIVNNQGNRFVAEDSYHGRTASFIMRQPAQVAWLIVDSEIFAYPEMHWAGHRLVDGWETIGEMEKGLGVPAGSLQRTLADYNRDVAAGVDRRFRKHPDWLKTLDASPWAAFDISFGNSKYVYITLGGLRTTDHAQVLNGRGRIIPGLYAAGACAAHLATHASSYSSGLSLGPGSFFGRRAGIHAASADV